MIDRFLNFLVSGIFSDVSRWSDLFNVDEKVLTITRDLWDFKIVTVDKSAITIGTVTIGSIALVLGVIFSKFLSRKISRRVLGRFVPEKSVRATLESFSFYFFVVVFGLFSLRLANVPLTIFTIIGSAIAIGVGFGSQNIVNNFISGIILMVERPVKVGDFIEVDGIFGEVEHIGIRSTNILSYGNRHIIVPNSSFLEKNVYNWTRTNHHVRINVRVGVVYGAPTEKVTELLIQAAKEEQGVLDRNPIVFFTEFGDNALNFEVHFWTILKDLNQKRTIESGIRYRIDRLFREHQIVIAFPQRDVHLYPKDVIEVKLTKEVQ